MNHLEKIHPKLFEFALRAYKHAPAYINYALSYSMMPTELRKRGVETVDLGKTVSPSIFKTLSKEYSEVLERIAPYKNRPFYTLRTVNDGTITREAGLFVYGTIRSRKPNTVVETGIYNGFSTSIILAALNRNRKGQLYSTDINRDVGRMLKNTDTGRWNKRIGRPESVLRNTLKEAGKLDVFIHDSDHSYKNMLYEFNSAYVNMSGSGFILSDDVDMNESFWDFARSKRLEPRVVYSPIKFFGVIDVSERTKRKQG